MNTPQIWETARRLGLKSYGDFEHDAVRFVGADVDVTVSADAANDWLQGYEEAICGK